MEVVLILMLLGGAALLPLAVAADQAQRDKESAEKVKRNIHNIGRQAYQEIDQVSTEYLRSLHQKLSNRR